jgi:hypothetical protein
MDPNSAMRQLILMRTRLEGLSALLATKRKKWKPSEKAFTLASYKMDIDAINFAIETISKRVNPR